MCQCLYCMYPSHFLVCVICFKIFVSFSIWRTKNDNNFRKTISEALKSLFWSISLTSVHLWFIIIAIWKIDWVQIPNVIENVDRLYYVKKKTRKRDNDVSSESHSSLRVKIVHKLDKFVLGFFCFVLEVFFFKVRPVNLFHLCRIRLFILMFTIDSLTGIFNLCCHY